jgi:hypothetical protein
MTDKELLTVLEHGGYVAVPYFDGERLRISELDLTPEEALPALKRFLTLSAEQRRADGRHLVAYCALMVEAVGEEILADVGGVAPDPASIWDYVSVSHIFFGKLEAGKYAPKPTIYLQIEGNVSWEPEHGLQMSWADGERLVKVGAFDGHPTNGHAMANPAHDQYVFSCYREELCTLPDPG